MPLLSVKNLKTVFHTHKGDVIAVNDVSFDLERGQTLGLVGESGCGKSVTALSLLQLVPSPPGEIVSGSVTLQSAVPPASAGHSGEYRARPGECRATFESQDLLKFSQRQMRSIRGKRIAMVFQEPMTSLNPVFTIGTQMREMFSLHQPELSRSEVNKRLMELLEWVGISDGQKRLEDYPHQFSGGMRQRVLIAMALSCKPDILIADEPTTALDVTIQAQILELIERLQKELGMAMILITHDFGVVAHRVDRVVVMYAGSVIEQGSSQEIFERSRHPYTYGLLKSIPRVEHSANRLYAIPGNIPDLIRLPSGCRFAPRCEFRIPACEAAFPTLSSFGNQHLARCIRPRAWEKS